MSKEAKAEMITQSTILDMGWTKSMIVKLLPEPILKPNPHYRCAAPMKLWIKQDVLNEMETEDFKKELEKANRRKASSQKSKNTKTINLKGKMQQIADSITVTVLPTEKLEEETLKSQESRICEQLFLRAEYLGRHYEDNYEEYQQCLDEMENFKIHRPNDGETMQRWIVNYIRHNLVDYDRKLDLLKGKTGKDEAYCLFKEEILKKIADAYPCYAEECNRQIGDVGFNYCWR